MQDILKLLKPLLGEPNVHREDYLSWNKGWSGPHMMIEKRQSLFGDSFIYTLKMDNDKGLYSRHELKGEDYLGYILLLIPTIKWIMNDGNL